MRWRANAADLVAWLALGVLVPAACLLTPPLHVLGPEFTAVWVGLHAGAVFVWTAEDARRARTGPRALPPSALDEILFRAAWRSVAWTGTALVVLAAARSLHGPCRVFPGIPFFVATWLPAAGLASISGASAGSLAAKRRGVLGALVLIAVASAAHDALQAAVGTRAVPVDLFLGELTGADQRSDLTVSPTHAAHGVFVLALAAALWCVLRARLLGRLPDPASHRRARRRLAVAGGALSVALAAIVAAAGDAVGIGWAAPALGRDLAERHETSHFVIRYPDVPHVARSIPTIARAAEWHYRDLAEAWGVALPDPVRIYVFEDGENLRLHTGSSGAWANLRGAFLTRADAVGTTLPHELVHAVNKSLRPSWRVILHRALLEGLAMAYDRHYARLPDAHAVPAAALAAGNLPHVTSFLGPLGFLSVHEGVAYEAAGSFVGFLILEHGFERFRALERTLDWSATYGRDLARLDEDWRRFLSSVPVPPGAEAAAARRFDPERNRPFLSLACPRVGAREGPWRALARRACSLGDWNGARDALETLWKAAPGAEVGLDAVQCLDGADRPAEGLAWIDRVRATDPGRAASVGLDRWETHLALRLGDWERLGAVLPGAAPSGSGGPTRFADVEEQALADCLARPDLREAVATLWTDPRSGGVSWSGTLEAHPDFGPIHILYALRGAEAWELAERLWAIERFVAIEPSRAGLAAPALLTLGDDALGRGDDPIARAAFGRAAKVARRPLDRFLAQRGLARLEFEKGRETP